MKYAGQLERFIGAHYPEMEAEAEPLTILKWKQLDEIDAGVCDGLTYAQVAADFPEETQALACGDPVDTQAKAYHYEEAWHHPM